MAGVQSAVSALAEKLGIALARRDPPLACRRMLKGHFGKVYAVHWAPDSQHVASVGQDSSLILWDALTAAKVLAIKLESPWVMSCAVSPSMGLLASGGLDNVCKVHKVDAAGSTATFVVDLAGHEGFVACCRFVDETHILTASGDSTCILWDTTTAQPITTFTGHSESVMTISTMPQAPSVFVSGACDHTAKLWDQRQPGCLRTFAGHEGDINSVDFLRSGRGFGTGSDDTTCKIFDLRAEEPLCSLSNERVLAGPKSIALSASGRLLFAGYPGRDADSQQCLVWDTLTGTVTATLAGHDNDVSAIAVAPDGMSVCTASWDTVIRIWA